MKLKLFWFLLFGIWCWAGQLPATYASTPPIGGPVQLRQDLNRILADHRFSYPNYFGGVKRAFNKFLHWLASALKPKKSKYTIDATGFDRAFKQFGLGLALLLPIGLIFLARRVIHWERRIKPDSPPGVASGLDLPDSFNQAKIAATQGEYRNAVRFLYLASLTQLRGSGILPEGIRYTDKENLYTLRRKFGMESREYQSFEQLIHLFREKWYGWKICTESDYQNAFQLYETLLVRSHPSK